MRRHPLHLAAVAVLAAVLVIASGSAEAAPPEREWREVFSPDGTITRMYLTKDAATAQISTQTLAADAAVSASVVAIQNTGPSSARFDLVIIGDGYTASEMGTLRQHADAMWNSIATTAPWSKYRGSINVWLVNVISNQSGVDNDPYQGVNRDTALDMYFWCGGIERLLCLNEAKAQQYANQAPGVDAIVAVGNSTKYGGAGYPSLATAAGGNDRAARIVLHELGHSVGGLADEYYTPGTTYTGGEPREPNITTNSRGTKWASYLGQSTPDGGVIGVYQGAGYYEFGIYRPSQDSLMRNLDKPFNLIGLAAMDSAIASKISGGGGSTCTGYAFTRTGSLSAGGIVYQPDGSYYYAAAGTHRACLDGPTGANFNLYLQKWNGSSWQTVASGTSTGPDETITYGGTAGYYIYQLRSVTGSGSYTFAYTTP